MIQFRHLMAWLVICLVMAGCSQVGNGLFVKKDIPVVPNGREVFQPALRAFQDAEFSQARKHYEAVLDSAADPLVIRKARYGAACSALAGASNEAELKEAQQLFEKWALEAPGHLQSEDPRLLYPVLKDYYLQSTNTVLELKKDCRRLQDRSKALRKEKEALKAEKARLEEANAGLVEENSRLEEEVAKLQKQLDALEELQNELRKMRQDTEK